MTNPYDRRDRSTYADGYAADQERPAGAAVTIADLQALAQAAYERGRRDQLRLADDVHRGALAQAWQEGHDAGETKGAWSMYLQLNGALGVFVGSWRDLTAKTRPAARSEREERAGGRTLNATPHPRVTRGGLWQALRQADKAVEDLHAAIEAAEPGNPDGIPF